jgi:hypothetical protein
VTGARRGYTSRTVIAGRVECVGELVPAAARTPAFAALGSIDPAIASTSAEPESYPIVEGDSA